MEKEIHPIKSASQSEAVSSKTGQFDRVKRNLPRDVFLHLFAMVTLYWSAVTFIMLCWQYVDYFLPDPLNYYGMAGLAGPIRFAVASLIIVFPLFVLVSWFLNKIYRKESQVRESKIRKWLIYLTLFITSLVIVGDLVSLINTFLGGEITTRFILKAVSILVVAVIIFVYYLDDVRRNEPSKLAKYFVWITGIAILIAVVGAFFIVGSPATARLVQFDQQRVNDLQNIQFQIVNYWQKKEKLPQNLADLNDPISGFGAPIDPQTKKLYEYNVKDVNFLMFELCATFNLNSNNQMKSAPVYPAGYSDNWNHLAGHVCFERTIDKQLYPPIKTSVK